jgi:o-succinylbenzoate synthase
LETNVGLAAQLALAGALPDLDYACGLGTLSLLEGDVVDDAGSLRPVNGYLPVPRTPPQPDAALLNTHSLIDTPQVAWWRDRLARVRVAALSP